MQEWLIPSEEPGVGVIFFVEISPTSVSSQPTRPLTGRATEGGAAMRSTTLKAFALAILLGGLATACGGDDAGPSGPESPGAQPPMDQEVLDCLDKGDCEVASNEAECPDGFRFKARDGDSNPPAICQRFEESNPPPDAGTPPDSDAGALPDSDAGTEQPTPDAGTPPDRDPCENLRVIEGEWERVELQWSESAQANVWVNVPELPLSVRCEPMPGENTCAVYFSGEGNLMIEGQPYFGQQLPIVYNGEDAGEHFTDTISVEGEYLLHDSEDDDGSGAHGRFAR